MYFAHIFQVVLIILSVTVTCISLSKWLQPRLLFFACMSILISLISIGYLLEITANSLDGALAGLKLQQCAAPFIGMLYFLFCMDYCAAPRFNRKYLPLLFVVPAIVAVSALTWPMQTLYFADISFVGAVVGLRHTAIVPGFLYYVGVVYNLAISCITCIIILRYYRGADALERRHATVVLSTLVLPVAAQLLRYLNIPGNGWNLVQVALVIDSAILVWYIARYREPEWLYFGRELIVENMKDAFILLDTHDRFLDANTAAYCLFPELKTLLIGSRASIANGFPPQLLARADTNFTIKKDDNILYLRSSRSTFGAGEQVFGTGIIVYDDTENQRLMDELHQLATHDSLTGLYNRGTFFNYAARDFSLSSRKKEPGSILMMDIDHFKKVNDAYGHARGDKVLASVSATLLDRLRHTDICGRYGGEELVVWLPGAPMEGALIIADVIRRAIEHTTFEANDEVFRVTISIGVASMAYDHPQTFDDLVNEADNALYQAKNTGRNRVCVYQPTIPAASE